MIYLVLRYLHIATAAGWLAATAAVASDLWHVPEPGGMFSGLLVKKVGTGLRRDLFAGITTLVTGLALASPLGAPTPPRMGVMVGLGITVLLLGLIGFVAIPEWKRVSACLESKEVNEDLSKSIQKLRLFIIASHLLWLVALATMVYPA